MRERFVVVLVACIGLMCPALQALTANEVNDAWTEFKGRAEMVADTGYQISLKQALLKDMERILNDLQKQKAGGAVGSRKPGQPVDPKTDVLAALQQFKYTTPDWIQPSLTGQYKRGGTPFASIIRALDAVSDKLDIWIQDLEERNPLVVKEAIRLDNALKAAEARLRAQSWLSTKLADKFRTTKTALDDANAKLLVATQAAEAQAADADAKMKLAEDAQKVVAADIAALKAALDKAQKEAAATKETLERQLAENEASMQTFRNQLNDLEAKVGATKAENAAIAEQRDALIAEMDATREREAVLKAKLEAIEKVKTPAALMRDIDVKWAKGEKGDLQNCLELVTADPKIKSPSALFIKTLLYRLKSISTNTKISAEEWANYNKDYNSTTLDSIWKILDAAKPALTKEQEGVGKACLTSEEAWTGFKANVVDAYKLVENARTGAGKK